MRSAGKGESSGSSGLGRNGSDVVSQEVRRKHQQEVTRQYVH